MSTDNIKKIETNGLTFIENDEVQTGSAFTEEMADEMRNLNIKLQRDKEDYARRKKLLRKAIEQALVREDDLPPMELIKELGLVAELTEMQNAYLMRKNYFKAIIDEDDLIDEDEDRSILEINIL